MQQDKIKIRGQSWTMRPIETITPYAKNAKIHSAQQIARLRDSLREFGFVRPLLIDGDGNLLSGHGTLEAARAEGMVQVPCVLVDGLTEAQRRAYIHADNKLSELSSWDEMLLDLELQELTDLGIDMTALGFELGDLGVAADAPGGTGGADALDLGDETDRGGRRKTFHCPKCGFIFEADA